MIISSYGEFGVTFVETETSEGKSSLFIYKFKASN
jgi:hypothetical protein